MTEEKFNQLTTAITNVIERIETLEERKQEICGLPITPVTERVSVKDVIRDIIIIDGANGNELVQFLVQIDAIVEMEICDEVALMAHLVLKLKGIMAYWWRRNYKTKGERTWQEMKLLILSDFVNPIHLEALRTEEIYRFQRENESMREFIMTVEAKAKAMGLMPDMTERQLTNILMSHINPATFDLVRYGSPPSTISDILKIAADVDGALLRNRLHAQATVSRGPPKANESVHQSVSYQQPTSTGAPMSPQSVSYPQPTSTGAQMSSQGVPHPPQPRQAPKCYRCGVIGHTASMCSSTT